MSRGSARNGEGTCSFNDFSLQLNRWVLKPIGAWPLSSSSSRLEKTVSFILIVICYFLILFTLIPCILHIALEDDSLRLKLKMVGPLSHWFIGVINYTTLLLQRKEMRGCIQHMEKDWKIVTRTKDQLVMIKHAKIGRYIAAFCTAFMHAGVLTYCVVTGFITQTVMVGNETRAVRMLPCATYKTLIPADTSPTKEIVLASQFVSGFIVNSIVIGSVSIAVVFASHAHGQLSIVMTWIDEFVNRSTDHKRNVGFNEIGLVVEHHLRVLRLIRGIENVMNGICFMELLECTINICMLGYYILTEWSDHNIQNQTTYFIILTSMSANVFIICYIGDVLTEKCKKIGEAVYMTNWYYLPDKDILNLIQIILRSGMLIKITACKLVHMSIYTFGDVIKTAFAYLNLLRQMT